MSIVHQNGLLITVNTCLRVAQNERDRTAERIKVVFQHKRKNKEACFGGPHKPMGYMKQKDENGITRLVKDPAEEQMTQEFWDILVKQNNLSAAVRYMNNVYGAKKAHKTWLRVASSPFYCGMWEDIEDFCEPYVSREDWLKVREMADRRRQDTRAKRTYLFSGLMKCPECGATLCGTYKINTRKGQQYSYHSYRCRFEFTTCGYKHSPSEKKIEKYLLANVRSHMEKRLLEADLEKTKPKPKPKVDVKALKERLVA